MLRKLYIEPTTKCNLNCKMCFRHTWFDEPICDLSMEDFRKALDTMPSSVETIFFGGMGEPLFHRDILQMVRNKTNQTNYCCYKHHADRREVP